MDWKAKTAEALVKARRARMQANNLHHNIDDLRYGLHSLGGYDNGCALLTEAIIRVDGIIKDLFELEGELSRTK